MWQLDVPPATALIQQVFLCAELIGAVLALLVVGFIAYVIKTSNTWHPNVLILGKIYVCSVSLSNVLKIAAVTVVLLNATAKEPTEQPKMLQGLQKGIKRMDIGICLLYCYERYLTGKGSNTFQNMMGFAMIFLLLPLLNNIFLALVDLPYIFNIMWNGWTSFGGISCICLAWGINRGCCRHFEGELKEATNNPDAAESARTHTERNIKVCRLMQPFLWWFIIGGALVFGLEMAALVIKHVFPGYFTGVAIATLHVASFVDTIMPIVMLIATLSCDTSSMRRCLSLLAALLDAIPSFKEATRTEVYEMRDVQEREREYVQGQESRSTRSSNGEELPETENMRAHFGLLSQYWRHPNPVPPGYYLNNDV